MSSQLDFIDNPVGIIGEQRFTVVSTFSGCGGSSLGYMWAGGKVLLAVEWDDNAANSYRRNFPNTDIYQGDIATLTTKNILERTKLVRGQLDIFDGSPPCQGFSTQGKRDFRDARNQLFTEYNRILMELQPKVFIMENVSGMIKGSMKLIFADILRTLKASGYKVSARLLDAKFFGVPQSRQRIIFIGVRDDINRQPTHPSGQTTPIVVARAFEGLSPNTQHEDINHVWSTLNPHSKAGQSLLTTREGKVLHGFLMARRLAWHRTAGTVQTGGHAGAGSWFCHPTENRGISLREAARLCSFPDTFRFEGSMRQVAKQVGNCVPPRFMQAIAEHVYNTILQELDTS